VRQRKGAKKSKNRQIESTNVNGVVVDDDDDDDDDGDDGDNKQAIRQHLTKKHSYISFMNDTLETSRINFMKMFGPIFVTCRLDDDYSYHVTSQEHISKKIKEEEKQTKQTKTNKKKQQTAQQQHTQHST
jgi:hypothetical protein